MDNWIDIENKLPPAGKHVLLLVVYQRFIGGTHDETDVIITGGLDAGGDWFVGNKAMMWDLDFNLDFGIEDISHWMPLPELPKAG